MVTQKRYCGPKYLSGPTQGFILTIKHGHPTCIYMDEIKQALLDAGFDRSIAGSICIPSYWK